MHSGRNVPLFRSDNSRPEKAVPGHIRAQYRREAVRKVRRNTREALANAARTGSFDIPDHIGWSPRLY